MLKLSIMFIMMRGIAGVLDSALTFNSYVISHKITRNFHEFFVQNKLLE